MLFASPKAWFLLAQADAPASPGFSPFMLWPFLIMALLYMFIVHRPQRREQQLRQAMLANVKKNDHVLLNCGIFGVVTNVRSDADELTIRVDESSNAKLRVTRGAIARVITDEPASKTDTATDTPGT